MHHLETADQIFILKSGRIEASGTYTELMKSHLSKLSLSETPVVAEKLTHKRESRASVSLMKNKVLSDEKNAEDLLRKQDVILFRLHFQTRMNWQFCFMIYENFLKILKKDREEVQQMGAVGLKSYTAYLSSGWGFVGPIIVMFFFATTQATIVLADYLLSDWLIYFSIYKFLFDRVFYNQACF